MSDVDTLHDTSRRHFASDNYAGAHPEVLAALAAANGGHQRAYGADAYTERLQEVLRGHFGPDTVAYPVFNGTGANVLALQCMLPRWGAVICADTAHINTDENAAPERVGGLKLLTVPHADGKITPDQIDQRAVGFGDQHRAQPGVVSITQATELGTVYTPEEIAALTERAHHHGLLVHLDGSRLANAAAFLDVPLRALTTDVGIDVVSLGGTKNGILLGEAVLVLTPEATEGLTYQRKVDMQLASKMRFISAQLLALYDGDLWLRSARHANAMAARLAAGVADLPGVHVTRPVQANGVFATLPRDIADRVREIFTFYDWDAATGEVRWMCSFDTTEQDVDDFVTALRTAATATA